MLKSLFCPTFVLPHLNKQLSKLIHQEVRRFTKHIEIHIFRTILKKNTWRCFHMQDSSVQLNFNGSSSEQLQIDVTHRCINFIDPGLENERIFVEWGWKDELNEHLLQCSYDVNGDFKHIGFFNCGLHGLLPKTCQISQLLHFRNILSFFKHSFF